jgi:hypothetical protein
VSELDRIREMQATEAWAARTLAAIDEAIEQDLAAVERECYPKISDLEREARIDRRRVTNG